MTQKNLSIILAIIALVIGIGIGIIYQMNAQSGKIGSKVAEILNSNLILPPFAQGTVDSINGKEIVLAQGTDKITVKVANGAEIYSVAQGTANKPVPTRTQINFDQLKKGDNLEIGLKPMANGELQGFIVFLHPPQAPSTQAP